MWLHAQVRCKESEGLPGEYVRRDCTQSRSTSCRPCTEGTYMNQPTGELVCLDCTTCDADSGLKTKTLCTRTSDTVCEPLEGFHCVDSTDGGCRAAETHSSCRPGQFISRKGTALSDTVCSNCTEGTFSNGTLTSCQPHTKCETKSLLWLINPGTISADAECGGQISNWAIFGIVVLLLSIFLATAALIVYSLKKRKAHSYDAARTSNGNSSLLRKDANQEAGKSGSSLSSENQQS